MNPAVERARKELDLARAELARTQRELAAHSSTLDPKRQTAGTEHGTPGIVGEAGEYQWLTSVDHDITDLLGLCPAVVLNRYLAVTSIDSGALQISEQDRAAGWWTSPEGKIYRSRLPEGREYRDDWLIAYSPLITSIHDLPNETHCACCMGFDEWLLFEQPAPVCELETFVNWGGFLLCDPNFRWLTDRLWRQLASIRPESYIADGDVLTFVTRNAGLFDSVLTEFAKVRP